MDKFAAGLAVLDDDLIVCRDFGMAFQHDMTVSVAYDESYFNKCAGYEGKDIAVQINRGRIELVAKHFGPTGLVCDVGIGSGEFIKTRKNTYGRDVNPLAIDWLHCSNLWADDLSAFRAFTFWDVIEHCPEPEDYFKHICVGGYVFTSVPIFSDLTKIRESKHYRPGEHLYYWTDAGFVRWMRLHGFELLERDTFEMKAGRDSIYSYAFRKEHK